MIRRIRDRAPTGLQLALHANEGSACTMRIACHCLPDRIAYVVIKIDDRYVLPNTVHETINVVQKPKSTYR